MNFKLLSFQLIALISILVSVKVLSQNTGVNYEITKTIDISNVLPADKNIFVYGARIGDVKLIRGSLDVVYSVKSSTYLSNQAGSTETTYMISYAALFVNNLRLTDTLYHVGTPVFCTDEKRYVVEYHEVVDESYVKEGINFNGQYFQGDWLHVDKPVLNPTCEFVAYSTYNSQAPKIGYFDYRIVMNNQIISETYHSIKSEVAFVPQKSQVAFAAMRDGKWAIYYTGDTKLTEDFDDITQPYFNPATEKLVYGAMMNNTWSLYSGEKLIHAGLENIENIILSSDGLKIAYKAQVGKNWCVMVNDEVYSKTFIWIDEISFSPDNMSLYYEAGGDKNRRLYMDEKPVSDKFLHISNLKISPDGNNIAFIATNGKTSGNVVSDLSHFLIVNNTKVSPVYRSAMDYYYTNNSEIIFVGFEKENNKIIEFGKLTIK